MISNEYKNAVKTNDKLLVRIMLTDSLIIDTSYKEFNEMEEYAEKNFDLYEKHDGEVLDNDPTHWTKDYMNDQLSRLPDNFSHERVDLLKRICRKIYGCSVDKNGSAAKSIGVGMAIAGGVTAVAGAITAHTGVVIAGCAFAAIGIFLAKRGERNE